MFTQITLWYIFFFMIYGAATLSGVIASIYLLLRRGNAFMTDVTPAERLRRWVVAFLVTAVLCHVWWFPFGIYSDLLDSPLCLLVVALDSITLLPFLACTLVSMLQDCRRPVWPFFAAMSPFTVLVLMSGLFPGAPLVTVANSYMLLLYVVFSVYIVVSLRQYGRWLRDNYADLEHKEVWRSQVVVLISLLVIILYEFEYGSIVLSFMLQTTQILLFAVLVWRVETLPRLDASAVEPGVCPADAESTMNEVQEVHLQSIPSNIGQLLDDHCVTTRLYLQHDLTLAQLSKAVGTNRFYLSQYFSSQHMTYNAYINGLRINHFVSRYRELTGTSQHFTAQQLAYECGYRSYSTFSLAFKQRMGQTVTAWTRQAKS
jgi:AraC-like DNA-binding protein